MFVFYTTVGQQVRPSAESRRQEGTYVLHGNLATGNSRDNLRHCQC